MKKTTARAISFLVLLLTGVPAAAQGERMALDEGTLEKGAPPRIFAPGPRWTGRWIVHVERDGAQHRAVIKEIGVLRRARDQAALDARIADYRSMMELLQAPVVELVLDHGAVVLDTTWIANTVLVEGAGEELLDALLAREDVALLQPDAWAKAQLELATDAAHHDSDKANTITTAAGVAIKGDGVTIAIIDSGVDADHAGSGRPHAAYFPGGNPANPTGPGIGGSRLLSAVNSSAFYPSQPAEDIFGHGTRMASIAGGAEFNALPDVDDGPAPEALIRSYKISDDFFGGLASILSMEKAFQDILSDPDVVVANMSYDGTPNPVLSPNTAIADATLADVFVTLSAGNLGFDLSFAHGCYNALVVGASDVDTKQPLVLFGSVISAIGPLSDGRTYPHLLAVGEAVTCAELDNEAGSLDSFGTSAGAAFVAGSAALVRQADPSLTALEVKALLLNTSEEITLGHPDARGFGYLRTDRAVEDTLAENVVLETVTTGIVKTYNRFITAGDEMVLTLVWNRESSSDTTIDDLDLRVRDPLGQVIAWSASLVDNVEQIRFTAAVDGIYKVQVIPIFFDGDGMAEYALAGVDTPSIDPGACSPGAPVILDQSPTAIPTLIQGFDPAYYPAANTVTLTGCNFNGTTLVLVEGASVTFNVVDDNTLTFSMPIPTTVGQVPITIMGAAGTLNDFVAVVPAKNVLNVNGNILFGGMALWIGGTPGDLYALAYSPDLVPSVIPGVVEADIGAGFTSLFVFFVGNLNPTNGVDMFHFSGISGTAGEYFYFQGVTIDPVTMALPWKSTNPATSIFTH